MTDDDVLARLRARTTTTETCWLWDGATNSKGYGRISVDGRMRRVHRVGYAILGDEPLDPELVLHHTCRNRRCWRPDHLTQVPSRTNTLLGDGPTARHARARTCPQGHPYTRENTRHARGRRHCRTCDRHRSQRKRTQHRTTTPTQTPHQKVC